MKIEVGKYAGFCRGVKDAVNKTFETVRMAQGPIFTDGELIHNPQTLQILKNHNVSVYRDEDPIEKLKTGTVIIRAHGVTPERRQFLKKHSQVLKNYTCPDVGKVQATIKKWNAEGYAVIIYGKKSHPEVVGLLGYTDNGHVVYGDTDIEALPPMEKALFVSQTTMNRDAFDRYADVLKRRIANLVVENTICDATELRQGEVKALASRNDCLIVIGGRNSSNSNRLFDIGKQYTKSYFVEELSDLNSIDFSAVKKVGVTAGASTPDWFIDEIVEEIRKRGRPKFSSWFNNLLLFSLNSNILVAIGAFLLSFAVADNLKVPFSMDVALIVALYYLSMSLMNSYTNRFSFKIDNPRSFQLIRKYRWLFFIVFCTSLISIFVIAVPLGNEFLILTLFSLFLGIAYNLSYLSSGKKWRRIFFFKTTDLLALKSLVLAFAVTILLNGLTLFKHYPNLWMDFSQISIIFSNLGIYFSVYYVFLLMFTRQALFEMKTTQSDRIVGVSSLMNIFSKRTIKALLLILPALLLMIMIFGLIIGAYPMSKFKYFIAVGYTYFIVFLSLNHRIIHRRILFEMVVESNLYVAGLISFI